MTQKSTMSGSIVQRFAGLVILLMVAGCKPVTETGQAPLWDAVPVQDFSLTECHGQTIGRKDLLGKPWLACFVFTRCATTCPRVTVAMSGLQNEFKDLDMHFVSFTVDPKNDTPAVLREYSQKAEADPQRWYFLTGDQAEIYGLIHQSFKMPVQELDGADRKPGFEVIHSNNIMYVDAEGRVQGKFNAVLDDSMNDLRRFLRTPPLVRQFPAVNASLNALATLLLVAGFLAIKLRRPVAHKRLMLGTFAVSVVFLCCYLTYHYFAGSKKFEGEGMIRYTYLSLLLTHIVLAALVPVLAIVTIWKGLAAERFDRLARAGEAGLPAGNWASHRRWAWITFPIWLYVSVTGVVIYWMLYRMDLATSWFPAG